MLLDGELDAQFLVAEFRIVAVDSPGPTHLLPLSPNQRPCLKPENLFFSLLPPVFLHAVDC